MDDRGGCITTRVYPLIMGKVSLVMGKDGATRIINGNSWKRSQIYLRVYLEECYLTR